MSAPPHARAAVLLRRPAAAAAVLLIGLAVLCAPPLRSASEPLSWESLLAPYSLGTALPNGFRIESIRRGTASDIVVDVRGPAGEAAAEVHVLQRGRWSGARESKSFSIDYELPRSPSAQSGSITALLAETIRRRDHGLPSPDLIPLGAAFDPGILPWWLDMLRGWRGVLIGTNLVVLALLAVAGSPALAIAGAALAAVDLVARFAGVPYGYPDLGGAWVLPGAAILLALALRGRPAPADLAAALLVGAFGGSLRLLFGTWGPHHPNGYAPLFVIGAARDAAAVGTYGPGYPEVFAPVAALAPSSPDWAIFACNALVSGLAATLAFAIARSIGLPRAAAAAGAILLAIDPVAIRTAATESYFPVILVLSSAAGLALLLGTRELAADARWRAAACFAAAALLLVQAARIQPSAWVASAVVPSIVLAADAVAIRRRAIALIAGGAMIGGLIVATSGSVLLDVLGHIRGGALFRPSSPASLAPLAWIAAGGIVHAVLTRRPGLSLAAGVSVATVVLTRQAFWEAWIWQQSYERVHFSMPAIALAAAVPAVLYRRIPAVAVTVLGGYAWLHFAWPIVSARTTDHFEYRWLRDRLLELSPACRVIHVESAAKRSLVIPTYVRPRSSPAVSIVDGEPRTLDAALAPADCLYYVRTSLCSSAEGRAACDAVESRLVLAPVARASFPARPSRDKIPYDRDPVETVIARVERVTEVSP